MPLVNCGFINDVMWSHNSGDYAIAGNVHVWRIQATANPEWMLAHEGSLSAEEIARGKQYRHESDRQRFIVSKIWLRMILSEYLGMPPGGIVFAADANNKPFVQNGAVHIEYNVAHSGELALVAIAETPIGIDIEKVNPAFDHTNVLPISFTDVEAAALHDTSYDPETFYRMWTRKEALAKASGKGIDNDFRLLPSMDGEHKVAAHIIGSDKNWNVSSFFIRDYAASVAYSNVNGSVRFFDVALSKVN